MALFDTNENIVKFAYSEDVKTDKQEVIWSNREDTMKDAIGTIKKGYVKFFITNGSWSMYELLKYILNQTGPADIDAFTWNLSMPAVNVILALREQKKIKTFRMLCHSIRARYSIEAISVLQHNCEKLVMYQNHAKGFLLSNDNWKISVISSANFSNNPQIEGGVITTDENIYKMHRKWLDPLYDNKELLSSEKIADNDPLPPPPPDDRPRLFLVRGLPGSGKSLFARSIAEAVFENDDYFYDINGNYNYDRKNIEFAIVETYSRCRNAMEDGIRKIAVANTFTRSADLTPYFQLAAKYGYIVHSVIVENRQNTENIHDVSIDRIKNMRGRFDVKL